MRVGLDLKYIRNGANGANLGDEIVQRSMARLLPATDSGIDFVFYLRGDLDIDEVAPPGPRNVTVRKMSSMHNRRLIRNLVTFPIETRRRPVDLFHASASIPYFFKGRTIMTMWEFSPLLYPQYFPLHVSMTRGIMYRSSIRRASHVITGTNFMKGQIRDYFGLPEEKIHVIPIGVDQRFTRPVAREEIARVRVKYGIKNDYLLSVGDLYPKKNIPRLMQAVNLQRKRNLIKEDLVVVGSKLWKNKGLQELDFAHTIMTGFVAGEDLPALYQGARAFVYPSLYEGFGIPVLESMASGTPMALSDNTSFPEIAGDAAAYFDPHRVSSIADTLARLLGDDALLEEKKRLCLERVRHYRWENIMKDYTAVYRSVSEN